VLWINDNVTYCLMIKYWKCFFFFFFFALNNSINIIFFFSVIFLFCCLLSFNQFLHLVLISLSGFTKLVEETDVETVAKHLNAYFDKMMKIIFVHGGDIIKIAGDALICLFDQVNNDQVMCALFAMRCCLGINAFVCLCSSLSLTVFFLLNLLNVYD
jgi:hypothetical protein